MIFLSIFDKKNIVNVLLYYSSQKMNQKKQISVS